MARRPESGRPRGEKVRLGAAESGLGLSATRAQGDRIPESSITVNREKEAKTCHTSDNSTTPTHTNNGFVQIRLSRERGTGWGEEKSVESHCPGYFLFSRKKMLLNEYVLRAQRGTLL